MTYLARDSDAGDYSPQPPLMAVAAAAGTARGRSISRLALNRHHSRHWLVRRCSPRILLAVIVACALLGWLLAAPTEHFGPRDTTDPSKLPAEIPLPHVFGRLQQLAFEQFDAAARGGRVAYDHSPVEEAFVRSNFSWHFLTSPLIGPAQLHPTFAEDVARVGDTHMIHLDRRAPYRPTLLLEPFTKQPSTADFDPDDMLAASAVLRAFDPTMIMAVSVGENAADPRQDKVMRVFAKPDAHGLWPNEAWSDWWPSVLIEGVPFRHFVLRLHPMMPGRELTRNYHRVLAECKKLLVQHPDITGVGYTIMMTKNWVAAIPRRHAGLPPDNNPELPEVMLGMVSVGSDEARQRWETLGYEQALQELGVPFDEHAPTPDP